MKNLSNKSKAILMAASMVTLVAFAETYYDFKFYSDSFMEGAYTNLDLRIEETEIRSRGFESSLRAPQVQSVDLNKRFVIDGAWEIVRLVIGSDETVEEVSIDVQANLINSRQVRVNNQETEIDFFISEFREGAGKMVLFQTVDGEFEILELRKKVQPISAPKLLNSQRLANNNSETAKLPKFDISDTLKALSGVNPVKSRQVVWFDKIEGEAEVKGNYLTIDGLSLNYGKAESKVITLEASINNVGMFDYDHDGIEGKGLVSQVGDNEIQVRFSTGVFAPISVTFVTPAKYDQKLAERNQNLPEVRKLAASLDNEQEQEENYQEDNSYDSEPSDVEERRESPSPLKPVVLNQQATQEVQRDGQFLSEDELEEQRELAREELMAELEENGELNLKEGEGYSF